MHLGIVRNNKIIQSAFVANGNGNGNNNEFCIDWIDGFDYLEEIIGIKWISRLWSKQCSDVIIHCVSNVGIIRMEL